jgi:hypothetical protein
MYFQGIVCFSGHVLGLIRFIPKPQYENKVKSNDIIIGTDSQLYFKARKYRLRTLLREVYFFLGEWLSYPNSHRSPEKVHSGRPQLLKEYIVSS